MPRAFRRGALALCIALRCIYCDRSLTTGRLYFELHTGPACGRCVERRDLYDEIEPAHCAATHQEDRC